MQTTELLDPLFIFLMEATLNGVQGLTPTLWREKDLQRLKDDLLF